MILDFNMILPIFSSEYSISRSLLTLEEPKEIEENKPVSIFSIAKKHELKEVYLADNSMTGFVKAYKGAKALDVSLRFGVKLMVCADMKDKSDKSDKSFNTESKVTVWMLNSEGYKDLIKIVSLASCDGFYYIPRIDWTNLNKMLTPNLLVTIPFYDSFIHQNLLNNGVCVPSFDFKPIFETGEYGLPFDFLIKNEINNYCGANGYDKLDVHYCYYYKKEDFLAYLVLRSISNRSKLDKPELNHLSSDEFNFIKFYEKTSV